MSTEIAFLPPPRLQTVCLQRVFLLIVNLCLFCKEIRFYLLKNQSIKSIVWFWAYIVKMIDNLKAVK